MVDRQDRLNDRTGAPQFCIEDGALARAKELLRHIESAHTLARQACDLWHTRIRPTRLRRLVLAEDAAGPLDKLALLSYIVHPFFLSPDNLRFYRHINNWRAQEIVRILNLLGYRVDVIDYRDKGFRPRRPYDLFIGHGGVNVATIAHQLPSTTPRIYFATGPYWRHSNARELERVERLHLRRGIALPPDRLVPSEDEALRSCDGIIVVGNDLVRETFVGFAPVIALHDVAVSDGGRYDWCARDNETARRHFLYFAGPGPIHKGLDLLLDAFAGLEEQHLWVCGEVGAEFRRAFAAELTGQANIHPLGWVQARGKAFYELMNRCCFCMLPSCGEGQAHSVLECSYHGLVPVITPDVGFDARDYGVLLGDTSIEALREVVCQLSAWPARRCAEESQRARRAAVTQHSEEAFRRAFSDAVQTIVAAHGRVSAPQGAS